MSWLIPGDCPIIGGAMDITGHTKRLIAMLTHTTKKGKPKVLKECLLPVTARGVVDMIVTDLAVIAVTPEGLVLNEVAPGYTPEEIQALTEAKLTVADRLTEITLS